MNPQKPSLQQFQKQIETLFMQSLTSTANLASKDFWENWSKFYEGISKNSIRINVDMLFLSRSFPEYRKYNVWKGLSFIILLVGIILLFFYKQVGIILLIFGVSCYFYSKDRKITDAKKFANGLRKDIMENPFSKGMAKLCAHYIAGIIQLASANQRANWPEYPSNVITGEKSFIK